MKTKIYFASDQHLGAPTHEASFPREQLFVSWLDPIKHDAEAIFLLGDLFDFWFEYQTVIPKGFVRVLGKLVFHRQNEICGHGRPYRQIQQKVRKIREVIAFSRRDF